MSDRMISGHWQDYELLDAGNGKKLERFGNYVIIRPELMAYFRPVWSHEKWHEMADAYFIEKPGQKGTWKMLKKQLPEDGWNIHYKEITFLLKSTTFKHIGIFPEQKANWELLEKKIKNGQKVLNLFSYTGANSLITANCGANTYHVDSSSSVVSWASENAKLSNIEGIHWVVEDALKFLQKEVKRGRKYDCITMDPPAFGLGPKKERWKIEKLLPELLQSTQKALNDKGWIILNTYAQKVDKDFIKKCVKEYFPKAQFECHKLSLKSKTEKIIDTGLVTHIYT